MISDLPRRNLRVALAAVLFGSIFTGRARAQGGVVPTMGKEFWLGFMANYQGVTTASLDIFISSAVNTTGTVSMPLLGLNWPFVVAANTTTTVTIPLATAMHQNTDVIDNKSILVQTADTVAVFGINFEQWTADGQTVYPVQSIGTEYRMFTYQGLPGIADLVSEFLIVATKDGTEVEITTTSPTMGGHAAGVPWLVQLDSGETYQVKAATPLDDFTGSTVVGTPVSGSCRPFALFSGAVCTQVPTGTVACDHLCEQNLPTNAWGSTYYTVPFQTTTEYAYRIMSHQNGTQVSVNGAPPFLLNAGQWNDYSGETQPLCITGNQPFAVAQYMEGVGLAINGDPALVILNAEEQMIDNVTFSTVGSTVITDHYLNVIVETASTGSVTLDGVPIPAASFNGFPSCPTRAYAQVPLTGGAAPVSHTLNCPDGLTAYVYGMGSAETYAYSVGSFTPVPPLNIDSVLCGLDSTGTLTLSPPVPLFNPFWTVISDPTDTLFYGLTYTFTPPASDVYVVTGFENLSFCQDQYYFSVEIDDPPTLLTTANGVPSPLSITVCAYEPVQLNVEPTPAGTYLYNWWPDAELDDGSLQAPVATPSQTTWYYVSVSTLNGCAVAVDSILINVVGGDVMIHDATTQLDALCLGDSSQLTLDVQQVIASDPLNGVTAPMWNAITGGVLNNACGSVTGDALYFDGAGTREAITNDLDVSLGGTVRFALKIATGVAPCEDADAGDNVVLEFSTNSGATWNPAPIGTYFEFAYPTFTNIDAVIPPAAMTASTRFRWRQLGAFAPGQDNWMLDNVAIAIEDATGLTFNWTPAATLSSGTAQNPMSYPAASGWYFVTTTDIGSTCTYDDSVYIDVGAPFSIDVTPDTAICDIAGIQLWATPSSGTNHVWNWTPAATLNAGFIEDPIATPAVTTEYFVTVTTGQGCVQTDSVTITVNSLLGLTVTASDVDLCAGENSQLNGIVVGGGPGLVYAWAPAAGLNNAGIADPLATPVVSTTYVLTVTDPSGCTLMDSVFINVSTLYQAIATEDTTLCTAAFFQLNVAHNVPAPFSIDWTPAGYLDDPASATPFILVDTTAQYIVQVADAIGCSAFDTVNVTVEFSDLTYFSDSSLCSGDQAVLDAGYPGMLYDWSTGATTQTIVVNAADDYTVVITNPLSGCWTTYTTTITVDPLPVVALGPDTSLCVGQNWTLNAGNPGGTYLWSTTATGQLISVSTGDDYWVQVTDANTCVNSDTIDVAFDPLPVIDLHDTTVCVSETILLNAENPGSWYQWSPGGQTTQTINVSVNSGTYAVVVTTPTWCADSADAVIDFIDFPVVDLGPDTALCDGEQITLDAQNAGDDFLWHNGSTAQTVTLFDDVFAWVDVYNGYCTTRDSIEVVFNPNPIPFLAPEIVTCLDYPPNYAVLDAGNPECTFLWNNGEITQVVLAGEYGMYTVHITTPLNCSIDDSVMVEEYCSSTLFMPNSFTPDGDGVNEFFFPNGNNLSTAELLIFDRWGELIHSGKDGEAFWDGKANGEPVQDGVYVWKVKYRFYEDTHHTTQSPEYEEVGHVTLIR